ncbi:MAG: hypothetical protein C0436_04300 [Alphaproteobacteria bacterium]|nr:hypothetical protein [Alphaproteobacteria bacterium]
MLHILQSITSHYPQEDPHGVASIQWQKQHYLDNTTGALVQRLSEAREPSLLARRPFTLRLEGPLAKSSHQGPYHITPVWNQAKHTLTLEISNERVHTPDSAIIASLTFSAIPLREEWLGFTDPEATANSRIRNRMIGAEKLRDRAIEQQVSISDSFAAHLFDCIAAICRAPQALN